MKNANQTVKFKAMCKHKHSQTILKQNKYASYVLSLWLPQIENLSSTPPY